MLSTKLTGDVKAKYKAKCVIGGRTDKYKCIRVYSAFTLQPILVCLLVAFATVCKFNFWFYDVCQVYVHFVEAITCKE